MRTMNSGELGADAVAAVLRDVVALAALGGAVDAKVAAVVVVGEDGLGVVVVTSSTLNRSDVVRDGPLLVAEDVLVVLGSLPALAADGDPLEGVLASLLVVGENGGAEDGDLVRAAF